MILLTGRYAGKKAVIVKNYDEGTSGRPYGHALVVGLAKEPRKVRQKRPSGNCVAAAATAAKLWQQQAHGAAAAEVDALTHVCSKGVLYQDQKQLAAKSRGWVQLLADRGYRAASRQPHSPASKADGVTGLKTAVAVAGIHSSSCGDKTPQQAPVQQGSGAAGTEPHTPQQITAVDLATRAQ